MPNPLAAIIPCEDRADGIYIRISPELKQKIPLAEISRILDDAKIVNYDAAKIAEVYGRARNLPERIGPVFELYNPSVEKYIALSATEKKATYKISSLCLAEGVRPSAPAIEYYLMRKGIVFGVQHNAILKNVLDNKYDVDIVAAISQDAVPGKDATVAYAVDMTTTTKPTERTNGTVDYRDIHSFVKIGTDQVIARKVPATTGEPGISVFGKELESFPGKDVPLPGGKNTRISPDGTELLASKSGVLKLEGQIIHVIEALTISGDLDFSVGNVKHSGDLEIKGSVLPGFMVEAEGNIIIRGVVESSHVRSRTGKVTILQGIIGKHDTVIEAKAGIQASFVQNAILSSEGTIIIDKYCLHSTCTCAVFDATHPGVYILGGQVRATESIAVFNAGNDTSTETRLEIFDRQKEEILAKIKELKVLFEKLTTAMEPIKKQIQTKAAIMKKAGDAISDRSKAEMKKWLDEYNDMGGKIKFVEQNIAGLKEQLQSPSRMIGSIRILADLWPGVIIKLYNYEHMTKEKQSHKKFKVSGQQIEEETPAS